MGGQQVHGSPSASRGEPLFRDRVPYPRGALWKCPAWGRPVNVALNLKVGEAGAPSPLEISRAIVADQACVRAARFPHSHSGHRRWL